MATEHQQYWLDAKCEDISITNQLLRNEIYIWTKKLLQTIMQTALTKFMKDISLLWFHDISYLYDDGDNT